MVTEILLPITIGLAIFLFGMKIMELALHHWAGKHMKAMLERSTDTPFRGMITGTGLTALLQSSSAITVVTIGLVNSKMLTYQRTLGIILGTNIGSCITTELISLNIIHWSLPALLIASCIWLGSWIFSPMGRNHTAVIFRWVHTFRYLSMAIGGFATVLIGMQIMHSIVPALQSRGVISWFLEQSQQSLLWGVVAGALLTAVIQSSAATIAIVMGLASVQVVSIELGIAIVLGANIGTCGTAFIASIGGSRSGKFVAWSHVILNVGGAIIFYPLIPLLQELSAWFSTNPSNQLAHSQTIYNILASFIALPLCYLKVFRYDRA